ncbi:MAG TPA: STAS domain-containing protein, partial [Rhodanobacteraceae bacterium]|nr:STAS domain-containing protein [Rhodanobacteraceae bacterium]
MTVAPAASCRVDAGVSGTLALHGELVFATAAQALAQADAELARDGAAQLDLAGISGADSAGLACVLALMAAEHARGRRLQVRNLPAGLHA